MNVLILVDAASKYLEKKKSHKTASDLLEQPQQLELLVDF